LASVSVWAEEPEAKSPVATTEPAGEEAHSKPEPPAVKSEPPVRDVFQSELRPFETPLAPSPDQPVEIQTVLEGISIGARGSRAVINGEVYKEGEDKMGIKILQIRKKEVDILINQSIKRTLSMLPGETRDIPVSPEETSPFPSEESGTADTLITEGQTENKEPTYA
jgi:hypothetical protein